MDDGRRIVWIDWMKTIGMMLIVWGHFFPPVMSRYVYAVNVPLFFIISGYLDRKKEWSDWWKSNWYGLILPYLLLCMARICMNAVIAGNYGLNEWVDAMVGMLGGIHSRHGIEGAGALWFVYILFIIKLLWRILSETKWGQEIVLLCTIVGAYIWFQYPICHPHFPTYELPSMMLAFLMFYIGNRWKKAEIRWVNINSWKRIVIVCIALLLYIISSSNNDIVFFAASEWGSNYFLYWLAAISGCFSIYALVRRIVILPQCVKLHSIGTILVLNFQMYLILLIKRYCYCYLNDDIEAFIYTVCIMVLFCPIIAVVNKWCPILIGNFNKRKE